MKFKEITHSQKPKKLFFDEDLTGAPSNGLSQMTCFIHSTKPTQTNLSKSSFMVVT